MSGVLAVVCGLAGLPVGSFLTNLIRRFGTPARDSQVAAATVVLFALAGLRLGTTWVLPAFLLFFAVLVAISVIDLDCFRIPNRIVFPALAASLPLLGLAAAVEGEWDRFGGALAGAGVAFGFLLVVHLVYPAGMGFGDVKLAAVLGLYLGWLGMGFVVLGLFLGFLLGSVVGIGLMAVRRKGRRDPIPFGPFLAAGAIVAVLAGRAILDWYGG